MMKISGLISRRVVLCFMLPPSSMQDSADDQPSPSDWSQISSLWPENEIGQTKSYSDFMDFIDPSSLSMDMNFNPSMSIEPSALHFDPININTTYHYDPYSNDLLAPQFPFMFQSPYSPSLSSSESSPQLSAQGRRKLSITSSSSSSGVSDSAAVSEAAHSTDCPHITPENQTLPHTDVPMAELAERVRQSAGVMIALPIASHLQAQMNQQAASPGTTDILSTKIQFTKVSIQSATLQLHLSFLSLVFNDAHLNLSNLPRPCPLQLPHRLHLHPPLHLNLPQRPDRPLLFPAHQKQVTPPSNGVTGPISMHVYRVCVWQSLRCACLRTAKARRKPPTKFLSAPRASSSKWGLRKT